MKYLVFIVVAVLVISCQAKKESIDKVWLLQRIEYPDEKAQTDFSAEAINPMIISQESFISLHDDGKYSSYFGKYEQGEWELKGDKLVLKPIGDDKTIAFEVRSVKDGKLNLYYAPRAALYMFNGFENKFDSGADDPFSFSNNKWRQKPAGPQSDKDIAERLKNHFRFYEKYFAWGQKNNARVLNVNNIASPLRIYGNGFELIHYSEQPHNWKTLFYTSGEVKAAYLKIYDVFQKDDLDWKDKEERFKMMESAFKQLQQKIK